MNLISTPVLGSAALLTSPALWSAFVTDEMPVDVAMLRFLVVTGCVWVALSVFVVLVSHPRPHERDDVQPEMQAPVGDGLS